MKQVFHFPRPLKILSDEDLCSIDEWGRVLRRRAMKELRDNWSELGLALAWSHREIWDIHCNIVSLT